MFCRGGSRVSCRSASRRESKRGGTHLDDGRVDVEVDHRLELGLGPQVELAVPALLVDAELELDLALVRVRELVDRDHVVGEEAKVLPCGLGDMREGEDDDGMRGAGLAQRVDEDFEGGELLRDEGSRRRRSAVGSARLARAARSKLIREGGERNAPAHRRTGGPRTRTARGAARTKDRATLGSCRSSSRRGWRAVVRVRRWRWTWAGRRGAGRASRGRGTKGSR